MPRSGGLLSGSRRATASGRAAPSSRADRASADLPPYETPACPLDGSAKRALSELANNRAATRAYDSSLSKSAKYLATSVGQVNDRVHRRRATAEAAASRRQRKGLVKSAQDERNEQALAKLEDEVPSLTTELEASMRQVIDRKAALGDERDVFKEVSSGVVDRPARQQRRRPRRGRDSDDEADPGDADGDVQMDEQDQPADPSVPGTIDLLEEHRAAKRAAYEEQGYAQRYSTDNHYILFKSTWHDALYPDGDVSLPDPSHWFDKSGNPVADAEGNEGGEDELIVAREVLSFKCPLSLKLMEEPYSSNKCKHTFEKEAILEFLRRGPKQCPQTGCSIQLRTQDMFFDEVMLRKIKRAADHARRAAMEATSDIEPDDEDSADPDNGGVRVVSGKLKTEKRAGQSSRLRIEDDIEDDLV